MQELPEYEYAVRCCINEEQKDWLNKAIAQGYKKAEEKLRRRNKKGGESTKEGSRSGTFDTK